MTTEAPLYNWLNERMAGALCHISSLPSSTGIGNFGSGAYRFIDYLSTVGLKIWQICPLGPTGYGDSPYQSFSAFAGNPYFIDFDAFVDGGLLSGSDLETLRSLPTDHVDYGWLYSEVWTVLEKAFQAFAASGMDAFSDYGSIASFRARESHWLEDYALFTALKEQNGGACWLDWPEEQKDFKKAKNRRKTKSLQSAIDAQVFLQYIFYAQLQKLRTYASGNDVQILGDVPIFVALDSADAWSNPELFQLDDNLQPTAVAGVPPDYFSEDGQLWGNPLYAWEAHEASGFSWWIDRMRSTFSFYDIVRIDHFRGFESYWSVPAGEATARNGKWIKSPGLELFHAIKKACPDARIVAEDLGVITPKVEALREQTGLPGMAVLQFAFGGEDDNAYLPHNVTSNTVIYTGTHDNDTTIGWYGSVDDEVREHVRRYFNVSGEDIANELIRGAVKSTAMLAIIPIQDLMGLGSEARLNTPGAAAGNWQWRFQLDQLDHLEAEGAMSLRQLLSDYGR